MKLSMTMCCLLACFVLAAEGADVYSLYSNHRAVKVNDILTVVVMESAKAGSKSGTNNSKSQKVGVDGVKGTGFLSFIPAFGAQGGFDLNYDGAAGTKREGSLAATVSARIIQVMENGNLVIEGSKLVEINEEKEIIKLTGTVRPQDIEANNTVFSYNIADAQITYSGKGTGHTGQRPGIISKILNFIF